MKIIKLNEKEAQFAYYGIRERLAAQQLMEADQLITITHQSPIESFTSWDVVLSSGFTKAVTEIKVRKKFSDSFSDIIFEKTKYDELTQVVKGTKAKDNNLQPLFITFFFDMVAVWNVSNLKEEDFKLEWLKASSVDGNQTKKQKMVTRLKIKDAHIINYKLDYDQLTLDAKLIFKYKYPTTTLTINNKQDDE